MSAAFFKELNIQVPDYNLNIGSSTDGAQTGEILAALEKVFLKEKPDLVVVYGDTNSELAGALAAVKLHIPLAHIEAGMRSGNKKMPEEINRIMIDHISELFFCSTRNSLGNLKKEGITKNLFQVGDLATDIMEKFAKPLTPKRYTLLPYILATVHRQENTDNKENLKNVLAAFEKISEAIIFPIHPRTRKMVKEYGWDKWVAKIPNLRLIEPVGFFDMLSLEMNAKLILTDSGGVQKEAYLARVPCITLRNETEWVETVKSGWNHLAGTDTQKIVRLVKNFPKPKNHPNFLGDGKAYLKIAKIIKKYLSTKNTHSLLV
jgi:UDP-N-acetylglucosamine 2-epimerase